MRWPLLSRTHDAVDSTALGSSERPVTETSNPRLGARIAKIVLPIVISGTAIYYLAQSIDVSQVLPHMSMRIVTILLPALLVYGAVSLFLEAMSLRRPLHSARADFTLATAGRVKAASYLLGMVHYAFGAGTLMILLRRRAGVGLGHAAGVVMLIMMLDLGITLSMAAIGASLIATTAVPLQLGLIGGVIGVIFGGFALLRAPFSLGILDRIRDLELFSAARSIPTRELIELFALRLLFVTSFLCMGWAALAAFEIWVPLGALLVNFSAVALVAVLPSVAGIGPSQVGMVEFFREFGSREQLLACSIALSAGMITMRVLIGLIFAGEFSREAYSAAREGDTATGGEA